MRCTANLTSCQHQHTVPTSQQRVDIKGHEGIEYARFQRTSLSSRSPEVVASHLFWSHWYPLITEKVPKRCPKGAQKVPKRCPGRALLQVGVDVAPCSRHSPPIRKWLVSSLRSAGQLGLRMTAGLFEKSKDSGHPAFTMTSWLALACSS